MKNKNEILLNIADNASYRETIDLLTLPVLNGFNIQENNNKNIIFVAVTEDKRIEQLLFDSTLKENETFEEKVEEIVKVSKEYMKQNKLEDPEGNLYFYKNYRGIFDFKIYVQNYVYQRETEKVVVKQMNAYFMEPKSHNFYLLTLSTGILKFEGINHDSLNSDLDYLLISILDNIKYNKNN